MIALAAQSAANSNLKSLSEIDCEADVPFGSCHFRDRQLVGNMDEPDGACLLMPAASFAFPSSKTYRIITVSTASDMSIK